MKMLSQLLMASVILAALKAWHAKGLNDVFVTSHSRAGSTGSRPMSSDVGDRVIAEGRVATYHGAQVTLSAEMVGRIDKLPVDEKSVVFKGDVIAEIQVDDLKARLAEAEARLSEIDAEIAFADAVLERRRRLRDGAATSQYELDKAQRNFDLVVAQRATAEATVTRVEATIAKSLVRSPIDGVVLARHAHPGEMADVGTELVTIADVTRVRIEAEVDEFDIGRVRVGQAVKITAEGFPDTTWQGVVEEIPYAVSEKQLRPLDPGRPSDARVLRVKIAFKEAAPLNLELQREGRVLPFPHHFLNNNAAMNVRPKNYDWRTFYDLVLDLSRYSFSWRSIAGASSVPGEATEHLFERSRRRGRRLRQHVRLREAAPELLGTELLAVDELFVAEADRERDDLDGETLDQVPG
jgi:HlyD family secretion protein